MSRDDGPALYAALGDSISIDEYAGGPGLGGPSLFARNRDDVFPQWRGRDLATVHPDLRYHLLAVDGGTTDSLLKPPRPPFSTPTRRTSLGGQQPPATSSGSTWRAPGPRPHWTPSSGWTPI